MNTGVYSSQSRLTFSGGLRTSIKEDIRFMFCACSSIRYPELSLDQVSSNSKPIIFFVRFLSFNPFKIAMAAVEGAE